MIIIVKYITIHSCTPKCNQFKTSGGIDLCYRSVRILYFIFLYLMFLLLAWKANNLYLKAIMNQQLLRAPLPQIIKVGFMLMKYCFLLADIFHIKSSYLYIFLLSIGLNLSSIVFND